MKLTLVQTDPASVAHLMAEGDITIGDFADPGKNPLELTLGPDWEAKRVIISLERVGFIDSSAIGWMFDCHRHAERKGGHVAWYAPASRVKDMIDLLKMRQLLSIHDTEADALASVNA